VLPRAGFRDDAALSHPHSQQTLPEAIVDLVRAGVQQVFAFDVDARATQKLGQPRSKLQRSGTPGKIFSARNPARSGTSRLYALPRRRASSSSNGATSVSGT